MKKISILLFLATSFLYAQNNNVGINTDEPTAKLHVNGNMRVQTVEDIDYSIIENGFNNQSEYKALYWDPITKEIFTKPLNQPYVKFDVDYKDNVDAADPGTVINLNPNDFYLFLTNISVENGEGAPNDYLVGVKNVQGQNSMPLPGYELKEDGDHYTFKAFYRHPTGGRLYYYDTASSSTVTPTPSNAPIWRGSFLAINKKYMEVPFDVKVTDYETYWDCETCGGKYKIELGQLIENNQNATTTVTATLEAKE